MVSGMVFSILQCRAKKIWLDNKITKWSEGNEYYNNIFFYFKKISDKFDINDVTSCNPMDFDSHLRKNYNPNWMLTMRSMFMRWYSVDVHQHKSVDDIF